MPDAVNRMAAFIEALLNGRRPRVFPSSARTAACSEWQRPSARRHRAPTRAIAADVAAVEAEGQGRGFDGQIWRHAEARKRLRGSALRLYPGLALDCAFGPGGACGGVEAPNWNACNPRCTNTIFDATQLAFLKDTAERIRSYLDDGCIGTTQRLLLQNQLN